MTYNNEKYWNKRGEGYRDEFLKHDKHKQIRYRHQERAIIEFLKGLDFESVLEVGCGFGRITRLVYDQFKPKMYDAFDLSPHQIENAQKILEGRPVNLSVSSIDSFSVVENTYDLIFASEVLMHIPFNKIDETLRKMVMASKRYVINLDWDAGQVKDVDYCFSHDYGSKYRALNCNVKVIRVPEPPLSRLYKKRKLNQVIVLAEKAR